MLEEMARDEDKQSRELQLNIRLSAEELAEVKELADHRSVTPAGLARTILLRGVRRQLGPRTEADLAVAILEEVARFEQLHGVPMPAENLVRWLDDLLMKGRHFAFNGAVESLMSEGKLVRREQGGVRVYATSTPHHAATTKKRKR
jgi:hypothetical protein